MSGLHEAVTRAMASARGVEGVCDCSEEATVAIRVCLAEAQRAVDANRNDAYRAAYETLRHSEGFDWDRDGGLLAQAGTRREIQRGVDAALGVALAVLAALAEDTA